MQLEPLNKNKNVQKKYLDQYYTKNNVADSCIDKTVSVLKNIIDIEEHLFFEPAAGYGCFYEGLKKINKKIIAYDIQPKHHNVKKMDFLNSNDLNNALNTLTNKKIITIGNPPFGKKSKLAIEFFNQASVFSDIISFIVPNQFKKYTVHKQLNKSYKLIYEMNLPKNSFYTENKPDCHIGCVFQIWTNLKTKYQNKRIKEKPQITHNDFKMYQYNNTKESLKAFDNDFDFAVFSQGYGDYKQFITDKKDFDFKKQYILFKCKNKKVIKNLKNFDFDKLSKENTTIPGFRKNNVVKEYIKKYG